MTNARWKLAFWLIGGLWSIPSGGQIAAAKPDLRVGDKWSFRVIGTDAGADVNRRWSRQIKEIGSDGLMRVERRSGTVDIYDDSWNPRHPDRPDFYPRDFQFPFQVGAQWEFASPPGTYFQNGGHKVVAYESITVPAGTFECFRLEGKSIYSTKSYSETWYLTRWYCPSIRYIAKVHEEVNIWQAYSPGSRRVLDSELIRFTPGK